MVGSLLLPARFWRSCVTNNRSVCNSSSRKHLCGGVSFWLWTASLMTVLHWIGMALAFVNTYSLSSSSKHQSSNGFGTTLAGLDRGFSAWSSSTWLMTKLNCIVKAATSFTILTISHNPSIGHPWSTNSAETNFKERDGVATFWPSAIRVMFLLNLSCTKGTIASFTSIWVSLGNLKLFYQV